jgi:hypothetical protein
VLLFVFIDAVFAGWSYKSADRDKFMRILLILDIPLIIAVTLVTGIKLSIGDRNTGFQDGAEYFEAGAVSFQLVIGCFVAYALELAEVGSDAHSPAAVAAQRCADPPETNLAQEPEALTAGRAYFIAVPVLIAIGTFLPRILHPTAIRQGLRSANKKGRSESR